MPSPGDYGHLSFPVFTTADAPASLQGVTLSVSGAPPWLHVDGGSSILGPLSIPAGETVTLRLGYSIGAEVTSANAAAQFDIILDYGNARPAGFLYQRKTWHVTTQNAMRSFRLLCQTDAGWGCGEHLSDDNTPPGSVLVVGGPSFTDGGNSIFVPAKNGFIAALTDKSLMDQEQSPLGDIFIAIDRTVSRVAEMTPYDWQPFVLAAGEHRVTLAAQDGEGNEETLHAQVVIVDDAPPATPLSLRASASSPSPWQSASAYPLTWQHPAEVSGVGKTYVKIAGASPAVLGPLTAHTVDLGANASQGSVPVTVWLEDNVQNVDPNNAAVVELRHDSVSPTMTASAPPKSAAAPIAVSFTATEAGAGGPNPTASGVKKAVLWRRQVPADSTCTASPGPWTKGDELAGPGEGGAAFSGSFSVTPPADGRWCFYAQAEDVAGNRTAEPADATAAHGETLFDGTPPVLSDVRVAELTPKKAVLSFESDEPAAARVEWGLSGGLGTAADFPEAQAFTATLENLPSPAAVFYKVTLVNRAGGIAASAVQSLTTPLDLAVSASIDEVIYPDQPIVIRLDNPGIGSAAYDIGGQAGPIPASGSFSLFPPAVAGPATLNVTIDGTTYSRAFIVDDPGRQYRIPRKVVGPGGEESASAGSKLLAAAGQPAATGAAPLASDRSQLFLGFLAGIDPLPPGPIADLNAVPGPGRGQVTLSWTAVGDDAGVGRAMVYELRRSASPILSETDYKNSTAVSLTLIPALAGTPQSAVVGGLPDGAQIHFALKALDEARNASPLGRVASAATLAFTASAETVGGAPAFELLSSVPGITVRRVESPGALPVLRAAAQGFALGGPLFEVLSPLNPLPAPGALTLRYDPAAVGAAEALLKIYRFDSGVGAWEPLADSRVMPDRSLVTATVGHFSYISLLAPDVEAPTTELLVDAGRRYLAPDGHVFLSAASRLSLSARDPPVGSLPGTGVSRSESRLDGGAFSPYAAPFALPEGLHTLEYRSFDLAANTETLRSAVLRLDAAAPRFVLSSPEPSLEAAGVFTLLSTRAADGGPPRLVVSVSDALTASGAGPGAGVARASVSLDGAPYAAFDGSVTLRLTPGRHLLRVSAEDNVGNAVTAAELPVPAGDLAPPRVALRIGLPRAGDFVAAGTVLTWEAEDDLLAPGDGMGAGAAFLSVLADGLPLASARREPARGATLVATATLAGLVDGPHALSWSAHDAFGNVAQGTAAVVLDARGPAFLTVTPASGAFTAAAPVALSVEFADAGVGVSSASVALAVDGLAKAVAAATAAARAEAALAQGPHEALWTAADLLGNAASTRTVFTADRTAPLVSLASPLGGERYVAGAGTIPMAFAVSDAFSASSAAAVLAQLTDRGSPRGARPALVAVSSGAALDPLALDDGLWELRVSAVDAAGNSTQAVSGPFEVLHDLRPPRTTLTPGTPLAHVEAATVVARGTVLTLASLDDMVGVGDALGLGVAAQQVSVDGIVRATFTAPSAGPGIVFISTFALASERDGWHEVATFATDVLGNLEASLVSMFGIDDTAPETSLAVLGGRQAAGPDTLAFYASSGTKFALPAVDRVVNGVASGLDLTRWQDNGGTFTVYTGAFALQEGPHVLAYQSRDRLGKPEVLRSTTVLVDAAAPRSSSTFGAPTLVDAVGTRFVTPATTLSLFAHDPALPGGTAGSGVERLEASVDGAAFSTYAAPPTFAEGRHTVRFRAVDRVGNVEAAQTLSLRSDASAPQTTLVAQGGRQASGGTGFYASSDTRFALAAVDPLATEVAAGVDFTRWQDNGGALQDFSTPFLLSEGSHVLGFQSQDRVSNLEAPRSSTVFVDSTAPVSSYSIGDPLYTGVGAVKFITPATPVTFSAEDATLPGGTPGAGLDRIEVAIDGGAFAVYGGALTFAEGRHTVLFRAVDRVGNVEASQTLALRSDATPPATALLPSAAYYSADGRDYAPVGFTYTLSARDPVVSEVASGVAETRYAIDSGVMLAFSAAFTLEEGSRLVEFQSRDNVTNLEAPRAAAVHVDATAPRTVLAVLGGRQAPGPDAGSFYASADTRYGLPAVDPSVKDVASGVAFTRWRDDGGAFQTYTAPFGLAEGRHILGYQSQDNVQNLEVLSSTTALVDATAPETTLAILGGRQYPGSDGSTFYASSDTRLALPGADPLSNGVASGLAFTRRQDNNGTYQTFISAFSLAEGAHALTYQSLDNVANMEVAHATNVWIDATPPVTASAFGAPYFKGADDTNYLTPATPLSFTAADLALPTGQAGSGVNRIDVAINGESFVTYTAPIKFPEGRHNVRFRSFDNVSNVEATKILYVQSDATPPLTSLAVQGGLQYPAGPASFYASSATLLGLPAVDPVANGAASGLAFTRWQDNGGASRTYAAPFGLSEGRHALGYQSQDNVQNLEVLRSTTVLIDATAPMTTLAVIGGRRYPGPDASTFYASSDTLLALPGTDPIMNGVASDLAFTRWQDNNGAYQTFSGAFSLAEGAHALSYQSQDNVANLEVAHATNAWIDSTPPVTTFAFGTPYFKSADGTNYLSPATPVTFAASDPTLPAGQAGSGVNRIEVSVDGGQFVTYTSPLTFAEGRHTVQYRSLDNVANAEAARTLAIRSDATPPLTALAAVGGRQFPGPDPVSFYASLDTRYGLPAADPLGQDVASGLAITRWQDNDGPFAAYDALLALPEGVHRLGYRSQDNVQNPEVLRSTTALVDATAPRTTLAVAGGRQYPGPDASTFYASSDTRLALPGADPLSNGVASGLAFTRRQDNNGTYQTFSSAFSLAEGAHALTYQSLDNVANMEVAHATNVWIDATPPVTASAFGAPYFKAADGTNFLTPATLVSFAALDPALPTGQPGSGVNRIEVAVDGGSFAAYTAPLKFPEGRHTVQFRSFDNVANVEAPQTLTVQSDATAPRTSFAAVGGRQSRGPDAFYASLDTRFDLPAFDPVVNNAASGLAFTRWQDNNGAYQTFSAAFSLAEGAHALTYQSQDNVANLEVAHATNAWIDATPPVTAFVFGTPYFQASDGTNYVTPATPLSFAAGDPALPTGQPGSGVDRIEVAVDGGPFVSYASPLTFAEGRHTVQYRSLDNVANAEAARTLAIRSDATPPLTALAAVGGRQFPGPEPVSFYASLETRYGLPATDPLEQDVASGLAITRWQDNDGPFAVYGIPFALPEGVHRLAYRSRDNVENLEILRSTIAFVDATAPKTTLAYVGGHRYPGPNADTFYASSDTRLSLPAADPVSNGVASGLASTRRQDGSGPYQSYGAPFGLAEGAHRVSYQSQDNVANLEVAHTTNAWIDATAPVTAFVFGAPYFQAPDGTNYVMPASPLSFAAADPALPTGQPGSAVNRIDVAVDGGPFFIYTAALNFGEGRHSVLCRAVDNVSNHEAPRAIDLQSDATPPLSSLVIGQPQSQLVDVLLVSTRTPFAVAALDPLVQDVASGVKDTFFRVSDTAAFQAYGAAFTLSGPDANKVIEFFSRDNVLNTEPVRSSAMLLDATPPELALLSPASCDLGLCRVLKGRFPVLGTARDVHLRDYQLEAAPGKDAASGFVRIGSGTVSVTSGTLANWDASGLSGWQTLRLTGTDLVLNVSALTLNVWVGDPAALMSLGNHDTFNLPSAVAAGPGGAIYVADRNNDRIAVFSSSGAPLAAFGSDSVERGGHDPRGGAPSPGTLRFHKPSGVAVDGVGNIYVADTNADRVLKLAPDGTVLWTRGRVKAEEKGEVEAEHGKGPGEFDKPLGVAVDAAGRVYVSDSGNHRVQTLAPDGAYLAQFALPPAEDDEGEREGRQDGPERGKPAGLALDAAGNVYVADPEGRRALKFGPAGGLLLTIPIAGGEAAGRRGAAPWRPEGVAVSPSGECILVSDQKGGAILKFDRNGAQNLAFGTKGEDAGDDPGAALLDFNKPSGLAMDAAGNLYVADRNNGRVVKLGLPDGRPALLVPPPAADDTVARGVVDHEGGGQVARKDGAAVLIPPQALPEDLKVTVASAMRPQEAEARARHGAAQGLTPASPAVEYGPEGTRFAQPVTLVIPYTPALAAAAAAAAQDLAVAYWDEEKREWEPLPSTVDPAKRTVSARTTHFSLYQVMAPARTETRTAAAPAADPAFVLRDLYVFPNPAVGGARPTIHVAVGLADKATIRIYDISGQLVHQATLDSPPSVIDDGNGPKFAYEMPWEGHIPSGVYLYSVVAEKNGQGAIRMTGKFAVVR